MVPDVREGPVSVGAPRPRRPDASMDLLTTVRDQALDPGYRAAGTAHRPRPFLLLAGLLAAGVLFGFAGASTFRAAPAASRDRAELIARIELAETTLDDLRARAGDLAQRISSLERASSGLDPARAALRDQLAVLAGTVAVTGPGVRIVLDDGPETEDRNGRVVDTDLRMVTNGLWTAGAEAVAVNGHRLTTRTPIRNAGDAITVDYRSLTRPYVVEAIGDPSGLAAAFADTEGGRWAEGLAQHYQVAWSLDVVDQMRLDADPGLGLEHARAGA